MRARGDALNVGHSGIGSAQHLCSLMIQHRLSVRSNDVGYRGMPPAMQDLTAGRLDVICDLSTTALPHVQSGNARGHAVTTPARLRALPDTPTLAEAGFPGFELVLWNALFAPAGTPRPIVDRLNGALREVLADPAIRARFAGFGTEILPPAQQTPEAAQARLQAEIVSIRDAVRAMGIEPER